ncbi:hypothetical protein GCM10010446_63840 [Streptomyces enissocaesilis]|uniref:Uroporphyrinogen-III synthase n=1 Tax=Streptomyces enissocaesilis TaxID=332589 RepID=A0ABN3XMJ9_9ACTN
MRLDRTRQQAETGELNVLVVSFRRAAGEAQNLIAGDGVSGRLVLEYWPTPVCRNLLFLTAGETAGRAQKAGLTPVYPGSARRAASSPPGQLDFGAFPGHRKA